jgi:hypothetical protein
MKNFKSIYTYFLLITILGLFLACGATQEESTTDISKSEIRKTEQGYQLFVNDEPFYIKGAGLEFGSIPKLAAHGANSMRTWRTDNGKRSGKEVLDEAHQYGLKVTMGIDVGRERLGFDYDDEEAVAAQLERIRGEVMAHKDHPALIIWGIGNELNHHSENPKVWDAVNEISKMIHEIDPNHLTTTSLAGMNKEYVDLVVERAPDLDILSVQMYAEIEILPQRIEESGYAGPLLVTEWGATGYWEVPSTEWGAPLENNSSVKADFYRSRYRKSIESQAEQVIGSYVFLWGQKQERTPTWFGMFMPDGNETESIDAMHYIWTGEWPANRTPRLESFMLEGQQAPDNVKLTAGDTFNAEAMVSDPDGDELTYIWEVMRESSTDATGGDAEEVPEAIDGLFQEAVDGKLIFTAPTESGAYRLFISVKDSNGHTAHANIPFWVEEKP